MKKVIFTLAACMTAAFGANFVGTAHADPQIVIPIPTTVTVYRMYYAIGSPPCTNGWRDFQSMADADAYRALSAPGTFTFGTYVTSNDGPISKYAWPGAETWECEGGPVGD